MNNFFNTNKWGSFIAVGSAGFSFIAGWASLLGPVTIWRNSPRKFFYDPPRIPLDATESNRNDSNLVPYFVTEYIKLVPAFIFFSLLGANKRSADSSSSSSAGGGSLWERFGWDFRNAGETAASSSLFKVKKSAAFPLAMFRFGQALKWTGIVTLVLAIGAARPPALALQNIQSNDFQFLMSGTYAVSSMDQEEEEKEKDNSRKHLNVATGATSTVTQSKPVNNVAMVDDESMDYLKSGYGIYRITRHPLHLGPALIALGLLAQHCNPAKLAFYPMFPLYWYFQAKHQDSRDFYRIDPEYFENTSILPCASIVTGRNSLWKALGELKMFDFGMGVLLATGLLYGTTA